MHAIGVTGISLAGKNAIRTTGLSMSDRVIKAQKIREDVNEDALADSLKNSDLPDSELDREMEANYCFADIYLRNAPLYLHGFLGEVQEPVHSEMRDPNTGLLAFEDGVCEISASSSFLSVAMSASDDEGLQQIRNYFEQKLRKLSDQNILDFDWRKV